MRGYGTKQSAENPQRAPPIHQLGPYGQTTSPSQPQLSFSLQTTIKGRETAAAAYCPNPHQRTQFPTAAACCFLFGAARGGTHGPDPFWADLGAHDGQCKTTTLGMPFGHSEGYKTIKRWGAYWEKGRRNHDSGRLAQGGQCLVSDAVRKWGPSRDRVCQFRANRGKKRVTTGQYTAAKKAAHTLLHWIVCSAVPVPVMRGIFGLPGVLPRDLGQLELNSVKSCQRRPNVGGKSGAGCYFLFATCCLPLACLPGAQGCPTGAQIDRGLAQSAASFSSVCLPPSMS